ncbi:MAG: hypothetical protein IKQ29_01290 [Bacilli bacterium]|nr:hypothetical protein [Bacilli bacterium]
MDDEKLIGKPKADEKVTVEKNTSKKRKINNKRLFILLGGVLVFFVVLFVFLFSVVMSPNRVVNKYVKGMKNFNAKVVTSTVYSDYLKAFKKENDKEFVDALDESFKHYTYTIKEYDVNYNYSEFTANEEAGYKQMLKQYYSIKVKKIKELRYYKVRYTIEDKNGNVDYFTDSIILAKIGLRWYVLPVGQKEE